MTNLPLNLVSRAIQGVVNPGPDFGEGPRTILVSHQDATCEALTYLPIPPAIPGRVRKAVVHVISIHDGDEACDIAVRIDWDQALPAYQMLPGVAGMDHSSLLRARAWLASVHSTPLREFLDDVLSIPEVFFEYAGAPAAPFRQAGSLLQRAVESCDTFLFEDVLSPVEFQLATTYVLLRDVANIWLIPEEAGISPRAFARGALWFLDAPMAQLEANDPVLANTLRELFLSPVRPPVSRHARRVLDFIDRSSAARPSNVIAFPLQRYPAPETP